MQTDDRIADYAFRHWKRSGMTKWPTVRQTAKALHIRQTEIEAYCGEKYNTQSYNCDPPQPFAKHEVYAMTPAVDEEWRRYYAR